MRLFTLFISAIPLFAFSALSAFAADPTDFIPIVPLPDLPTDKSVTFPEYINEVFRLAIILGGVLAVLMVIYGGFQYMTSEAIGKKDGKDKLQAAGTGLALLLFSYLILNIINPQLLNLDVLGPAPGAGPANIPSNFGPTTPSTVCPNNKCSGMTFVFYDETSPTGILISRQTCTQSGGTARDSCLDGNLNSSGATKQRRCNAGSSLALVCIPGK